VPRRAREVDPAFARVEGRDALAVFVVQRDVVSVPVVPDVRLARRLRDDGDVLQAERPRQRHLCGGGVVFLGNVGEHVVLQDVAAGERRVAHEPVVVFDGVLAEFGLLEERVELDLVREHRRVENFLGSVERLRFEVRDADVSDRPLVVEFVEGRERPLGVVSLHRPVDVEEVEVVRAEFLQALPRAFEYVVVGEVVGVHLRREEHLLPGDVGLREAVADGALVVVVLCGVDVAVAQFEGRRDAVRAGRRVVLPCADAESVKVEFGHTREWVPPKVNAVAPAGEDHRGYSGGASGTGMARPFITVSGPPGCGATTVAERVSEILGCEWVGGGDIFRELAEERGMTLTQFIAKAEEDDEIDRALDRRLTAIAEERADDESGFILESRLAGWLAGPEADIRIWLDAPTEVRVDRLEGRDDEFESELRVREVSEWGRYEDYYGIDIHDTSFYDLTLNTARWSPESVVSIVLEAVEGYDPAVDEGAFDTELDV